MKTIFFNLFLCLVFVLSAQNTFEDSVSKAKQAIIADSTAAQSQAYLERVKAKIATEKYPFTIQPNVVWTMFGEMKPQTIKIYSLKLFPNEERYEDYFVYGRGKSTWFLYLEPYTSYFADVKSPMIATVGEVRYTLLPQKMRRLLQPKKKISEKEKQLIAEWQTAFYYLNIHHYLMHKEDNLVNTLAADSVMGYILSNRFASIEEALSPPKNRPNYYLSDRARVFFAQNPERIKALVKGLEVGLKVKKERERVSAIAQNARQIEKEEYVKKAESYPKTRIHFESDSYDFGKIKEGDEVLHKFSFTNRPLSKISLS